MTARPSSNRVSGRPAISSSSAGGRRLPDYSRNLLKIRLPVAVTLATTKQTISQITSLVPGSIIQFNKLCDESLTLEIGNQAVAEGEAVKVGDKFGLRITAMTPPEERLCILERAKMDEPQAS